MRALVTGATGFIGHHLARLLAQEGFQVRAMARKGGRTFEKENTGWEWVEGDIRDRVSLAHAMKGCEAVFHVAALYAFWPPQRRPYYETNVLGTVNVMEVARELGVSRVVHTSTWRTVGPPQSGELANESCEPDPREMKGPYLWSKWQAEEKVMGLARQGMDVVVVNPTVPVGAGDARPTPTGRLVRDFIRGRVPAYVDTVLNVVDVEDVAWGHLLAFKRGRAGERYILGNENMRLKGLLEVLARITGRKAPKIRVPLVVAGWAAALDRVIEGAVLRREPLLPVEGIQHARFMRPVDCSRARRELGMPQTPVEVALEKAVRWYREKGYA